MYRCLGQFARYYTITRVDKVHLGIERVVEVESVNHKPKSIVDKPDYTQPKPLAVLFHKLVKRQFRNLHLAVGRRGVQQVRFGTGAVFDDDTHMRHIEVFKIRYQRYYITVVQFGLGCLQGKVVGLYIWEAMLRSPFFEVAHTGIIGRVGQGRVELAVRGHEINRTHYI